MRITARALPILLAATLVVAGCKGKPGDDPKSGDSATASGDSTQQAPAAELKIVKGEPGADVPDAKLSILSPKPNEVVKGDSVLVKVELSGVELKSPTAGETDKGIAFSKEGQHIHVIIDDKPYMAMYKLDSFSVGALSPGVHTLRAFPSRSWHESIKTPGAFQAFTFYVGEKSGEPVLTDGAPLLTYSRPKGDYKGKDGQRVLLDFYVSNATLGADKFKVVATVDGKLTDTLSEWGPYFIEGLGVGSHTVKLELIGPDGKPVPGAFNSVERKINVLADDSATASSTPSHAGH
jgi:hypothetical protein